MTKGNLMESLIKLQSIAKRYGLGINIYEEGVYLVNCQLCMSRMYDVSDPCLSSMDFEDLCKKFVEEGEAREADKACEAVKDDKDPDKAEADDGEC